jgi:endo-1,3(4)-beta-glucanase
LKTKLMLGFALFLTLSLVACGVVSTPTTTVSTTNSATTITSTEPTTEPTTTTTTAPEAVGEVTGLEDSTVVLNHYFFPLRNVKAVSQSGLDLTSYLQVEGHVDYGTVGSYELTYSIQYSGGEFTQTRQVDVVDEVFFPTTAFRPNLGSGTKFMDGGSYRTGTEASLIHPVTPSFLETSLLGKAVPSNGWWTTLLTANYGGSNGIYTNPLRSAFANEGVEITNPGDGFVQYWNPGGLQTIAQFSISLKDLYLKTTDLSASYTTKVIDYSDTAVKVAMRNNSSSIDRMVVTYAQGSPYVFAEVANKAAPYIMVSNTGLDAVEFYTLGGEKITSGTHTGDAIIVKMIRRHVGYQTSPPANVGSALYADRFFLVNTPTNTTFSISSNRLNMNLGDGNYLSVAAIQSLSEAAFYHEHGYVLPASTATSFEIDYEASLVHTNYRVSTQAVRSDLSTEPVLAMMPHHYKNSDAVLTNYTFRTVRGTLKMMVGTTFDTTLSFNGLLPGYTLPEGDSFERSNVVSYLNDLDSRTEIDDDENFFNADAPYWNSKALYPLSQGVIIADQIGEPVLRDKLLLKLTTLLADWYTYSGATDTKYLYYNQAWGTVYYSDNEFNTARELSDHAFTHGYLIYASAIAAMYDATFVDNYGGMVDLLLNDYMYPEQDDPTFAYLRSFDSWAGHSWAHGFGFFAEGNNLESTGEALNSWLAGYLWGLATGDQARVDVAIYGFTTELSAVKQYWFNYDNDNWNPAYSQYAAVAGMVWGGKFDYATWFGANPTFIYGIQWLPTGEYLTNYALNDAEYARFQTIYAKYLSAKNQTIDTWFTNMWAIQAVLNPAVAITKFNAQSVLNDDYPAELVGSYWMIHALDSLDRRTSEYWMEVHLAVASSIYETSSGEIVAMIWNATDTAQTARFYTASGFVIEHTVAPRSFTKVTIAE